MFKHFLCEVIHAVFAFLKINDFFNQSHFCCKSIMQQMMMRSETKREMTMKAEKNKSGI